MKRFFILIIMVTFFSCEEKTSQIFIDTAIDVSFLDKKENDLLNPNNIESLKASEIDVYYLIDGIKVKQYQGNLEFPEFFFISNELREGKYFLRLFPCDNNLDENNRAITYLKFKDGTEHKIECEFQTFESGSIQTLKVWYNDELRWEYVDGSSLRWFDVIK